METMDNGVERVIEVPNRLSPRVWDQSVASEWNGTVATDIRNTTSNHLNSLRWI